MHRLRIAAVAATAVALCVATSALGGSGVGATFNLGVTNSVNARTALAGTLSTGTAMLDVINGSASGGSYGVVGRLSSASAPSNSAGVRGVGLGAAPGVWGSQNGASGVYGSAVGGYGVRGSASSGVGVYGAHTSKSGTSPGVRGATSSTDPNAAGVAGTSSGSIGVYGSGHIGVNGFSNTYVGVWAQSNTGPGLSADSASGVGAIGTSATNYGVIGSSGSTDGLHGESVSGDGVAGSTHGYGDGIYGEAPAANVCTGTSNPPCYAGYFVGDLRVSGAITAGVKDFQIDDPLDPAHKYLQHTSVESSSMLDIYNGNVSTDGRGYVTVRLPNWFQALNKSFRYQLTVIGHVPWDTQARVWNEIAHNRFTIRTNHPNVRVSWQVTGVRHDPYANAYRTRVVLEKAKADQGKYLYPQLYGKPRSDTIGLDKGRKTS